jgi:hypothetical protein
VYNEHIRKNERKYIMNNELKNNTPMSFEEFLKVFGDSALFSADKALFTLLWTYRDKLPKLEGLEEEDFINFHKAFRVKDVTSVIGVDMAIWYMLQGSVLFWDCVEKVYGVCVE